MGQRSSEGGALPPGDDLPFRLLAQQLASPCWISDPEGAIVWVNDAWIAFTGADVASIRALGLERLHDPAVYGDVVKKWAAVKAQGAAGEMVFPLRGKDGVFRPVHTRVAPLRDSAGRIAHWFGVNTDVSAQSAAETALRASEEQLREVFERAGDGIFITDADGGITDANPAACAMGQWTREELLAKSVWELIDPGEQDALVEARHRNDSLRDWKIRRRDGTFLDVEVSSGRLSDGRRLGVARDVSMRRQAEQAERDALTERIGRESLRASDAEDRLRHFWEASQDLFAIVSNTDGVPRHINQRAWRETLGYSVEEVTSARLMDWVHPDDRERTLAMRQANLAEKAYFGFENRYRRKDGEWVWLSWNVVREGDLIYCSARDITERRAAQIELQKAGERLAQAQKMEALGQLTGGVAHDFNNLLMIMGGQASLMRDHIGDDPRLARALDAIEVAARRGEKLTRHLLAFGRRQRLHPALISLAAQTSGLRALLESCLGGTVAVHIDCADDLWDVEVDANEWELALLNMAVNARDAMPKGGALAIAARNVTLSALEADQDLRGDFVRMDIADTGVGIPADILQRVIDPFFTTKEVDKGTGLGLSQVYGFVQQSGGRMAVHSELGEGTTVTLWLPRAEALAARGPDDAPGVATASLEVLCIEDNPDVAEVAAGLLAQLGHRPRVVTSAAAALRELEDGAAPDLVFSDIVMAGDMDGLALAREIRRRWAALPVLLATGYSRAAAAIGDEFPILTKPYQAADLARALAAAVR
jgi:PAS domain S-box-containing protein